MKILKDITNDDIKHIIKLYTEENKTLTEIGNIIGISRKGISKILDRNNIKIRGKVNLNAECSPFKEEVGDIELFLKLFNECVPVKKMCEELGVGRRAIERKINEMGLKRPKSMMSRVQYDDSKDEMIVKLYNDGFTPNQIADKVGLSRGAVKGHLRHNNIKFRSISKGLFCFNKKEFPKELENYESLYDMYVIQKLSKKDIAETFNVATHVVNRCLKSFNIHVRNCSEAKYGLFVGEKHPRWKGGVSGLYVRLREYFRCHQIAEVVKRDGKKCQMCGSKHRLQVHHIRHFKDIFYEILNEHPEFDMQKDQDKLYNIMVNDERFNDLNNLITYCRDCHLFKVHGYKKHNDKKQIKIYK